MVLLLFRRAGKWHPPHRVCDGQKNGVNKLIAQSHRWQLTALAVAALMGLWGSSAQALSLGQISVLSALGEPLKAEIEILDINAEEASTLTAKVAPPENFKTAGLDYNAAMTGLQVTLQRRASGRAYLRLNSTRAINDPFVDMILEASWNTGRIVRDYTLLFDPPNLRDTAAPAQVPPAASQTPAAVAIMPSSARATNTTSVPKAAPAATKVKPVSSPKPIAENLSPDSRQMTVKPGDTAGHIASANKPNNVSLDQMLVAMLRANPDAFIGDNINRVKAGAIVTLPTEEQVNATSAEQASQIIIAQSQDFNSFRRQLASSAPIAPVTTASRAATGKVQANVEDKKVVAPTQDKLTLSKGAVAGKSTEDQLAQTNNAREASSRTAELAKNIQDLSKLASASPASAPAQPGSATQPSLPAIASAIPSAPVTVSSAPTPAASSPASAPAVIASGTPPQVQASAPSAVASAPKKPVSQPIGPPEPMAEPGLVDTLLDSPLLPAGAAGLLALLAGLAFYKVRQRRKAAELDSAFVESRLQPESFFGVSGGRNVDTHDDPVTGSSMIYSPSQLDAVDDVDPVAEADVYLAYGRDLQAEEILKDALRNNPNRLAIHQKLLEIYAKRRDAKSFEAIATLAFNLTDGTGADWEEVCQKGIALDPDNALYLPGGQPPLATPVAPTLPAELDATQPLSASHPAHDLPLNPVDISGELDLDLDFSLDEPLAPQPSGPASVNMGVDMPIDLPAEQKTDPLPTLSMNLIAPADAPESIPPSNEPSLMDTLDFSIPETTSSNKTDSYDKTQTLAVDTSEADTAASPDLGMMEFDLGSLSLDLGDEPVTESGALPNAIEDPLETKLALAEEFKAIGDDDGARALIEEVIAEAAGDMKAKAQRALKHL